MNILPLCAGPIVKLANYAQLVLRYESGFTGTREAVDAIARIVGISSGGAVDAVLIRLGKENVRREIARLERDVFSPTLGPSQYDPRSHWHPGHIGDSATGKYKDRLEPAEQAEAMARTQEYCHFSGTSKLSTRSWRSGFGRDAFLRLAFRASVSPRF